MYVKQATTYKKKSQKGLQFNQNLIICQFFFTFFFYLFISYFAWLFILPL